MNFRVTNITRGTSLGDAISTAGSSAERKTGLLKHKGLERGHGLWIVPCEGVHSFFMKFAIDVIYIDKKKRIRKLVRQMLPWRLSFCLPAHSVLELPVGTIDECRCENGDQLEFETV